MTNSLQPVHDQQGVYIRNDARAYAERRGATAPRLVEFLELHQVRHGSMAPESWASAGFRDAGYNGPSIQTVADIDQAVPGLAAHRAALQSDRDAVRTRRSEQQASEREVEHLRQQLRAAEERQTATVRALAAAVQRADEREREFAAVCTAHHDAATDQRMFRAALSGRVVSRDGTIDAEDPSQAGRLLVQAERLNAKAAL